MSGTTRALDAGERLRRLLALLAYLARVGEAPLAELSRRFGLSRDELVAELELAACCGLPPYTPDQLLELVVEEDRVLAYGLEALRRVPRLTPDEGFALAAAVRTLLAVEGADATPLRGALEKLEAALGEARLVVELDVPPATRELQRLAAAGEMAVIEYLGPRADSSETREVEPFAVVLREGRYYLDAFCHRAGDWRRFRIDRIESVRALGRPVTARALPASLSGERAFAGTEHSRPVRLSVSVEDATRLEQLRAAAPTASDDGHVEVVVDVADEEFLGRLLLRLGDDARVLDPPELADAARRVARRALGRYSRTTVRAR